MAQKRDYATKKKGKTEVYPFWNLEDIKNVVEWFEQNNEWDGYLITLLEMLLARRISDTISMRWSDLYYENGNQREEMTTIEEQKTGKTVEVPITHMVFEVVDKYCEKMNVNPMEHYDEFIFAFQSKTDWIAREGNPIYAENDLEKWCEFLNKDLSDKRKENILKEFEKQKKKYKTLIAKSSKEKIEHEIIINSKQYQENKKQKNTTLRDLYPKWIKSKSLHTNAGSYIRRIEFDWNTFYSADKIVDIPIQKLKYSYLDDWVHEQIKKHGMTKTKYYNMSMIIRQMMQYAFDNNLVLTNEFANVKVNSKMFVKKRKAEDYTQVFLVGEQEKIEEEIMRDLEINDRNVVPLAIYLNFQLGLRACELATIKFSDIHDKYIHIERMEVKDYVLQDDGTTKYNGLKVVPYTKSYAGDRNIYLTNKARDVISLVKSINLKHGYLDEDYIFINPYGNRASCNNIMKQIEKYCYRIGIPAKRVHKIRKTYISTLIDNSININKIRETVGHEDERTTLGNYTFNRLSDNETEQAFEDALKL